MPSDPRVAGALAALASPAATFRGALTVALGRASALMAPDGADRVQTELGEFARGRLDRSAFAALAARSAMDSVARTRIERAMAVLRAVSTADDSVFVVDVPRGGDVRREVALALARLGCGFGAMRSLDIARLGVADPAHQDELVDLWPFDFWTKSERQIAPPLVVVVDGADLRASALSDFLDGAVRMAILVRGPSAPAPLARLVTPGVLIIQSDRLGLDRLAAYNGPGVAALIDGDAAHFVHDPRAGHSTWQRLSISRRPAAEPKVRIGPWSTWQQRDELRHLEALALQPTLPEGTVGAAIGSGGGDVTQRLTDWLLEQVNLEAAPRA